MAEPGKIGLVTRQASFNAVHILLGTFAGAVNTIVVLPKAFAEQDGKWGVIIVLTSWALIFAQLLNFGAPNLLMRYMPRFENDEGKQRSLTGFAVTVALLGVGVLGALLGLGKGPFLRLFKPDDAALMSTHIGLLFILFACLVLNIAFAGYLMARLKSTLTQFIQETYLKVGYLGIALLYLFGHIGYTTLLTAYTCMYAGSTLLLLLLSIREGFAPRFTFKGLPIGELISYGLFSVLDRGISVIVHRTDFVMMGVLLGLASVESYNLAFYIAAVAMIPQKAISAIANPLVAKAIAQNDRSEMEQLYSKTSINQVLIGGLIFGCTWASIDQVMDLLPVQYSDGKWVVLFIGISKLVYLISGASGALIQFSKFYRANFVLNLSFFVLTVAANYLCMHKDWLNLGMEGAALATAASFVIYNAAKMGYVWRIHKLHPLGGRLLVALFLVTVPAALIHSWVPLAEMPFWSIVIKSGLVFGLICAVALALRLSPDGNQLLNKLLRRS